VLTSGNATLTTCVSSVTTAKPSIATASEACGLRAGGAPPVAWELWSVVEGLDMAAF
jgi:hypothetical protein